ncbi:MAG: hypothetical protein AAF184_14650 [Pseudomonadota bacterium]
MNTLRILLLCALSMGAAANAQSFAPTGATNIVVNGEALSAEKAMAVASTLGQVIAPGRYWYDHVSGLWGYEGGPAAGQLPPGLDPIDAPLRADASGGLTPVFINGRALHPTEVQQLMMLLGQVIPGRYSMNERWQVDVEGGSFSPPLVDLGLLMAARNGGTRTRAYGAVDTGNSVYLPELGGRSGGTSVGRASDGCTYVVSGGYSTEVCD